MQAHDIRWGGRGWHNSEIPRVFNNPDLQEDLEPVLQERDSELQNAKGSLQGQIQLQSMQKAGCDPRDSMRIALSTTSQ